MYKVSFHKIKDFSCTVLFILYRNLLFFFSSLCHFTFFPTGRVLNWVTSAWRIILSYSWAQKTYRSRADIMANWTFPSCGPKEHMLTSHLMISSKRYLIVLWLLEWGNGNQFMSRKRSPADYAAYATVHLLTIYPLTAGGQMVLWRLTIVPV